MDISRLSLLVGILLVCFNIRQKKSDLVVLKLEGEKKLSKSVSGCYKTKYNFFAVSLKQILMLFQAAMINNVQKRTPSILVSIQAKGF